MARYIEADRLKRTFASGIRVYDGMCKIADVMHNIENEPTADVEEVKHAKWEINSDGYYPYCSHCKTEPKNGVMSKYCPECGAKMDSQL